LTGSKQSDVTFSDGSGGRLSRPVQSAGIAVVSLVLLAGPFVMSSFQTDLACQVFLGTIGSLSLMLLTGYAGQISLGHAGLLAAGAFSVGIPYKEIGAPFWITIPLAAAAGALLGLIFGFPSLRLRGMYLAVSTLALHFLVVYLGGQYETKRDYSTGGLLVDPPELFGYRIAQPRVWYYVLLAFAGATLLICISLLRSKTGRAWGAIRSNETVAEAVGIRVPYYKLLAFVLSSAITGVAGALFAYYRGFVSIEAFSIFLTVQYAAMIIIGGIGSLLGAVLGAIVVTLFPYAIEALLFALPGTSGKESVLFALNYAAFGFIMIIFLVLEPGGVVGLWRLAIHLLTNASQGTKP
jgi:branched-chain amino acid transport system permease protein